MTTFGNDKLLFVHVPKTGGAWAAKAMMAGGIELRPEGDEFHPPLRDLDSGNRFTFAFVREPAAWYGSMWQFQRQLRDRFPDHDYPLTALDPFIGLPFPEFLQACIGSFPGHVSEMFKAFVGPPESPIDFIGRYEELQDDLIRALRLTGEEFDEEAIRSFPPTNTAATPAPMCPDAIRQRLLETEREAYQRFYPELVGLRAVQIRRS
jgi:hypothetical protein